MQAAKCILSSLGPKSLKTPRYIYLFILARVVLNVTHCSLPLLTTLRRKCS